MDPQRPRRILLTGATGFVGRRLVRDLSDRYEIVGTFRNPADVPCGFHPIPFEAERDSGGELVDRVQPDVVVHCLAIARGEACLRDSKLAYRVNVEVTREIAEGARDREIPLVFTSTDQVFDGLKGEYTEDDPPVGQGVYADTKIEAERILGETFRGSEHLLTVFRLALSYGWSDEAHPGPVGWILAALRENRTVDLFADEFRSPLFVGDISRAAGDVIEKRRSGLYHLAGADRMDRHTLGVLVARRFGFDPGLCTSRSVADHRGPEPRSPDCSMSSNKFCDAFGWAPRGVEGGLATMVKERID